MRTWQTKTKEGSKYKTAMGTTDYDIPMFGYRSALCIILTVLVSLLVISFICDFAHIDSRLLSVIFGGIAGGLAVAFSQFFIERKTGLCKNFWIVMVLISIVTGALIFLLYFAGIVL